MLNPRQMRILVIGGGPCGLVTLRNLLERGHFAEVQLVERRGDVGGVWLGLGVAGDRAYVCIDD
jgi:cation diffusion facilitator CzcD-associated flavoprotein CzcO